jgi:hypothetical protein
MSGPRDPDAIIAAWLEEGPSRLPETTRRGIGVAIRNSTQTRLALRMPWRSIPMNPFARTAIAVLAVIVVISGAVYLLRPGAEVGGVPATPTASPVPTRSGTQPGASSTAIDTGTWIPFSSARHGYSISHPSDWTVTPATRPWPVGVQGAVPPDPMLDVFTGPGDLRRQFVVLSQPLPNGVTSADWLASYERSAPSMPSACWPAPAEMEQVTLDGQSAWVHGGQANCGFIEAIAFAGGRVYELTGYFPVNGAVFDRATFDALIESIHFQPSQADDTPAASPSPS